VIEPRDDLVADDRHRHGADAERQQLVVRGVIVFDVLGLERVPSA